MVVVHVFVRSDSEKQRNILNTHTYTYTYQPRKTLDILLADFRKYF